MRLNRQCCGFWFVELVTSFTIISVPLLAAIGSVVVIAGRELPGSTSPLAEKLDAAR